MDVEPEIRDAPGAVELEGARGEVVFEDVHFSYDREAVLRGVSLVAEPGRMVALVGPSGAGKTTMIRLIMRFYDPDRGIVRLDGHDLRGLQLRSLRSHLATVMQDDFLFSGTVFSNIAYGRPDAGEEEVMEAARLANADEFIQSLPDGYGTEIGKRGVKLSEGQRQRVSIARALLKNPQVLLLDEATSSVDSETELLIQQAVDRLRSGRTTFAIAHRLSTILRADQILFIQNGGVLERGTHAELMARDGQYARFYRIQFEGHRAGMEASGEEW
jgi:ABC-type multidrug transport system fused ATPase/permease subunit